MRQNSKYRHSWECVLISSVAGAAKQQSRNAGTSKMQPVLQMVTMDGARSSA